MFKILLLLTITTQIIPKKIYHYHFYKSDEKDEQCWLCKRNLPSVRRLNTALNCDEPCKRINEVIEFRKGFMDAGLTGVDLAVFSECNQEKTYVDRLRCFTWSKGFFKDLGFF